MTDPTPPSGLVPEPVPQASVPTAGAAAPPAISIRHLWHRFGNRDVLEDVTFDVAHGEIFGFIGPNGAGKTTTIRIIATLLEPMAGRVEVDGVDVSVDPDRVRRLVGYMPDHAGVYDRVTVFEYLDFFARAFGVPDRSVVEAVIELVGLIPLRDRLISTMSKGMRQRLQIARILLHDPKVLVLDEPASDLDPRARIELRDLLLELRDLGKTVLLSSHILTELSDVCTSVGILERGRLLVAGPIGEIAGRLAAAEARPAPTAPTTTVQGTPLPGPAAVAVAPFAPPQTRRLKLRLLGDTLPAAQLLWSLGGVTSIDPSPGGWLLVEHAGDDQWVAAAVARLVGAGCAVVGVEPERNELERIFLQVTRGEMK